MAANSGRFQKMVRRYVAKRWFGTTVHAMSYDRDSRAWSVACVNAELSFDDRSVYSPGFPSAGVMVSVDDVQPDITCNPCLDILAAAS